VPKSSSDTWAIASQKSDAPIQSITGWSFSKGSPLPGLLLVQIQDSDGVTGVGETFYVPTACWEAIEHLFAPRLLGQRPTELGNFYSQMLAALRRLVGIGAEYRALSALDVALWDLVAKRNNTPLRQVLNPGAQNEIDIYNSCAGPLYASVGVTPGEGIADEADPRDDYGAWKRDAGALAQELVGDGFQAMKLWPFDDLAKKFQGGMPDPAELAEACKPLRGIRQAVGSHIDIMIDGHGLWNMEAATMVAQYCEQFELRWIEDLILAHPFSNLKKLKDLTRTPILASEYIATEVEFRELLDLNAVDVVMVDPTWAGGITNGLAVADLAETYSKSVSFHDCTGPATLLAGAAMASAIPNHEIQELARSFVLYVYPQIAECDVELSDGKLKLGSSPGLGLILRPDLSSLPGVTKHTIRA